MPPRSTAARIRAPLLALAVSLLVVALAVVTWPLLGSAARHSLGQPSRVAYIVLPHPDDEFEAWSLIEHDPSTYKVFITATRGEESGYCDPKAYHSSGWQRGLEPAPHPVPHGRWTPSCTKARLHSWVDFFTDMGPADATLPSDLQHIRFRGPFPDRGVRICRHDGSKTCIVDTAAKVWRDREGRGALVAFDLGDGDLTRQEVAWAVRTVKHNRDALGLDDSLPDGPLIGASFANRHYDCVRYPHPDHLAVHKALFHTDFGMKLQEAPTCASDPDADRSAVVDTSSARAAFRIGPHGTRLGAHSRSYGWLADPYYRLDRTGQERIYHTHQHFWVRFRR